VIQVKGGEARLLGKFTLQLRWRPAGSKKLSLLKKGKQGKPSGKGQGNAREQGRQGIDRPRLHLYQKKTAGHLSQQQREK